MANSTYVVQGPYPAPLLEAWTTYKKASKNAENVRPGKLFPLQFPAPIALTRLMRKHRADTFPDNQLYALVCLSHGGQDLETVKLKSWSEAASVLWQVALSLSQAEEKLQFEVSSSLGESEVACLGLFDESTVTSTGEIFSSGLAQMKCKARLLRMMLFSLLH